MAGNLLNIGTIIDVTSVISLLPNYHTVPAPSRVLVGIGTEANVMIEIMAVQSSPLLNFLL